MHLHIHQGEAPDGFVSHVRCRTCGRKLPGAPWIMHFATLTFCTTACALAWEGDSSDAPF